MEQVSCPSTSLCVGVSANAVVFSTEPTNPLAVWGASILRSGVITFDYLDAVDCPSEALCVLGDVAGTVLTSVSPTGGSSTWNEASLGVHHAVQLSCASASFCVGAGFAEINSSITDVAVTSTDPTGGSDDWQAAPIDSNHYVLNGIACPSTELCVAVDEVGRLTTSTNPASGVWSAPIQLNASGNNVWRVSCPTTTFCAVIGNGGEVFTSTNPTGGVGAWTATKIDGASKLLSLDCPSAELCIATDEAGNVVVGALPLKVLEVVPPSQEGGTSSSQPPPTNQTGSLPTGGVGNPALSSPGPPQGITKTSTSRKKTRCKLVKVKVKHSKKIKVKRVCPKPKSKKSKKH